MKKRIKCESFPKIVPMCTCISKGRFDKIKKEAIAYADGAVETYETYFEENVGNNQV